MSLSSLESLKIKAKLLQKKKNDPNFKLKQSYEIIARTSGYSSWKEMKDSIELGDLLNPPKWSAIWKNWVSTKKEALDQLEKNQFILPFRNNYFICTIDYINALGIKSDDPDLILVGQDWSEPRDKSAYLRIINNIKLSRIKKRK